MPLESNPATEKVRRLTDQALERLEAELKAGRSEALTTYLTAMARFHRYSWANAMLIQAQRPDATRVAGYHTWRELGRSVRRGEKGIMIYAPIIAKRDAAEKPEPTERPQEARSERLTGFHAAYVFDLAQTEGRPLPAVARTQGDPGVVADRLKAIVAERGIALRYDPSIAPADGLSLGGEIRLRPGLAPAEEFSVLAHELAHELLHRGSDRTAIPKLVRETQAEAVAFVVSRGIGLETGSAAADYIALYNGNAKTLTDSLEAVQEASSQILKDLLPQERLGRTPNRSSDSRAERETPSTAVADDRASGESTPRRPFTAPDPSDSMTQER